MASPIQSLEASYLVHMTEDADRIDAAVRAMLGADVPAENEVFSGHFGNRIVRSSYRLTGDAASAAFARLARRLPEGARRELLDNLANSMDEHSALYVRLDKQSLLEGELRLGGRESVRLRVKPRLFLMKEGAAEFFRKALETRT